MGLGGGEHLVDGPFLARTLGLRQRRRHVGLAGPERFQRQFVVFGEAGEAIGLDIGEKLLEAGPTGPSAGPAKPFIESLAVGDGPSVLLIDGAEHIGIVHMQQIGPLLKRIPHGAAVAGIAGDQLLEFFLIGSDVDRLARATLGREHPDELGDDPRRPHRHQQAGEFAVEVVAA